MAAEIRLFGSAGYNKTFLKQEITGFHQDESLDWVAELACGHHQHVRHNPPWTSRPWVTTAEGRLSMIGRKLACIKCDSGAPPD